MFELVHPGWSKGLEGRTLESRPSLKDMSIDELRGFFISMGEEGYRAEQVMSWMYRHGVRSFSEMTNLSKSLRDRLAQKASLDDPQVLARRDSRDGYATKYLVGLRDGNAVETVVLRYSYGTSICISTQVGCRMACRFCASALGGFVRNLTAGEMMNQILVAQGGFGGEGDRITHIVLMGSGEPLDNYVETLKFIRLAHHPQGFGIGYRRITVSTCGLVPGIDRLAGEGIPVTLSVSLHAPDDGLRDRLVPVNRVYPLRELIPACARFVDRTGRRITFEYVLLAGINDAPRDARRLAARLEGLVAHVNLIPFNPVRGKANKRPSAEAVDVFRSVLEEEGVSCTVRRELGLDIDAACGQLRRRYGEDTQGFGE